MQKKKVDRQVDVHLIFLSRESLRLNDCNVVFMKLVAESVLEVVFLIDRVFFFVVVRAVLDRAICRWCLRLFSVFLRRR